MSSIGITTLKEARVSVQLTVKLSQSRLSRSAIAAAMPPNLHAQNQSTCQVSSRHAWARCTYPAPITTTCLVSFVAAIVGQRDSGEVRKDWAPARLVPKIEYPFQRAQGSNLIVALPLFEIEVCKRPSSSMASRTGRPSLRRLMGS